MSRGYNRGLDALFLLVVLAFSPQRLRPYRVEVETVLLDDPLDLLGGDGCVVFPLVEYLELHLPPTEVLPSEGEDAELLGTRDLPGTGALRPTALLLQRFEAEGVVPPFPLVEALAGDAAWGNKMCSTPC